MENKDQLPQFNLTELFNQFAAKAVEDFPVLKDRLMLYHAPSHELYGPFSHHTGPKMDIWLDYLRQAAEQNLPANGCAEKNGDISIIYFLNETFRTEVETLRILNHELAHLVAPAGYPTEEGYSQPFAECVADVFSAIRMLQQNISNTSAIDALIWHRSIGVTMYNKVTHPSVFVLTELQRLCKEHDLSKLTPVQSANLAYRLSLRYAPSEAQISTVKKMFSSVAQSSNAYQELINLIFPKNGTVSLPVFNLVKETLIPLLENKAEILGPMTEEYEGIFKHDTWQKILTAIKQAEARIPPETLDQAFQRKLDYMQALGRFDEDPDKLIDPASYGTPENMAKLAQTRAAYSAKAAPAKPHPPSPSR